MTQPAEDERRRRHQPHTQDKFLSLTRNLDHAPFERKRASAKELVDFTMRSHYDCVSVLQALDYAYSAMAPGGKNRESGFMVLQGINDYFDEVQISHKTVLPADKNPQQEIKRGAELARQIRKNRDQVKRIPWFIERTKVLAFESDNFFDTVDKALADIKPGETGHILIECCPNALYFISKDRERFERERRAYAGIIDAPKTASKSKRGNPSLIRFATLDTLTPLVSTEFRCLFNPYTQKFGEAGKEVSLRDIVEFNLGKTPERRLLNASKIDEYGKMVLRYLASVPPGDFLWQRMIEPIFFIPSIGFGLAQLSDPQLAFEEKTFLMQKWLGEKLFLQALARINPETQLPKRFRHLLERDMEFDSLFASALKNLDGQSAEHFGIMAYNAAAGAVHAIERFYNLKPARAIGYCPIPFLAAGRGARIINITRDVQKLFHLQRPSIFPDLEARFLHLTERSRLERFKAGLDSLVREDYDKKIARDLVNYIKRFEKNLGGNFWEKLERTKEELAKINRHIVKDMKSVNYWPHSEAVHEVEFSLDSLPEIMGLQTIRFSVGEDPSQPVEFHIILKEAGFGLSGIIESNGEVSWKLDIGSLNPGLRLLLDYFALATFRDLLIRGEIVVRERRPRRGGVKVADSRAAEVAEGKPHRLNLPRPIYRYSDADQPARVSSDELRRHVETHKRETVGFTPRQVGIHRMNLPGVDQYLKAYLAWKKATLDQRIVKRAELVEARKLLHQPSQYKAKNLPDRFELEPLVDPDTEEQLLDIKRETEGTPLWRITWVAQFNVPKLTEAELASLETRYVNRYRGGSAMAFADELKLWILGIDEEE